MATVFLISRDHALPDIVEHALAADAHKVIAVDSLERVVETARRNTVELLIVDLTAFARDYNSICRRVRTSPPLARLPMLCLVHGGNAHDVAQVLDAGGDDCLRKSSLTSRELAARVRALLRRHTRPVPHVAMVLSEEDKSIQLFGRTIALTPTEYSLLDVLSRNPGQYVTASMLLQQVWHYPSGVGDPALVRNHVRNLRRKIEADPERPRIVTSSHGRGYTITVHTQRR